MFELGALMGHPYQLWKGHSLRFSCNYSRSVEVGQEAELEEFRPLERNNHPNIKQKYGVLKYDFKAEHVLEGGKIQIKISPKHQIKDIIARWNCYVEKKVFSMTEFWWQKIFKNMN